MKRRAAATQSRTFGDSTRPTAAQPPDLENGPTCSQANQSDQHSRCTFEEALLTTEVKRVINESAGQPDPFFLFWSMHLVHMPLQIPDRFLQKFAFNYTRHLPPEHARDGRLP